MPEDGRNGRFVDGYCSAVERMAAVFSRVGFGPMVFTIGGLVLAIVAGAFLWTGHLIIGGILLFAGGLSDSLDGAVARTGDKVTRFGALLDSTLDRYAEFAVFLGFYGYLGHSYARFVGIYQVIAVIALIGSVMVSYVRARSEALGVPCSVGFWQRPERVIALGTASVVSGALNPLFIKWSYNYMHDLFIKVILVVLAVGTNFTAIKRLLYVRRILRERGMD